MSLAVAALRRAGYHASQTGSLYHFAAGSWSREAYDDAVLDANQHLPKRRNDVQDAILAEKSIIEAINLLKRGDERDATDLEEAITNVKLACRRY